MFAVCQGGQALYVNSEQVGESLRFGLAELGVPGGYVLYGAVPLAQLHTRARCSISERTGARRIALFGQRSR